MHLRAAFVSAKPPFRALVGKSGGSIVSVSRRCLVTTLQTTVQRRCLYTPNRLAGQSSLSATARFTSSAWQSTSANADSKTETSSRSSHKDPEAQSGLYYHPTKISVSRGNDQTVEAVEAWAVSFLPDPPKSEDAVIAYLLPPLPHTAAAGHSGAPEWSASDPAEYIRSNPDRLRINAKGWQLMHDVLKTEVVPHDDLLQFEADTRGSGWAHLTDLRHPLMPGRIATPESIIASVAFVDGKLDVDSYQINGSYRLTTGYEGPIQMADSWLRKIRRRFESI